MIASSLRSTNGPAGGWQLHSDMYGSCNYLEDCKKCGYGGWKREETQFRTKPQLLEAMIERAIADIPLTWVTADEMCFLPQLNRPPHPTR